MVDRPYINYGIAQLEELVRSMSDRIALEKVLHEVERYRTTPRASRLRDVIKDKIVGKQNPAPLLPGFSDQPTKFLSSIGSSAPLINNVNPKANSSVIIGGKSLGFIPTQEQMEVADATLGGDCLKVFAFAGTGKTSTLQLIASKNVHRALYISFNKKNSEEAARKFLPHVDARTTHSLAATSIRGRYIFDRNKMFGSLNSKQLASVLDLKDYSIENLTTVSAEQQAYLLITSIRRFCQSDDDSVESKHVNLSGRLSALPSGALREIEEWACQGARHVWSRMISRSDPLPLGHDGYLKLWSLNRPALDYDYIMLDEAQDTNPVVLSVMKLQSSQIIYVGDPNQQIYEWRGAVNAMTHIDSAKQYYLTESFRFGPEIASVASAVLKQIGEKRSLKGAIKIDSRIEPDGVARATLCRKNATVISNTMSALERGDKPHIVGSLTELEAMVSDVFALMDGKPGTHPDFFGFKDWREVRDHAATEEGSDLFPFVALVERYGPKLLWKALKSSVEEGKADVVISTVHRAKGLEWTSVRIAEDFSNDTNFDEPISAAEARLFYVAITRARETLIVAPSLLDSFTRSRGDQRAMPKTQ